MPLKPQPSLSPIQRRVLDALLRESARLLVIGGYAVRAHGIARQSSDLDLWIETSPANADRITAAMRKIDIVLHDGVDLTRADATFSFPEQHKEIDLHTSFVGVPAAAFVRCEGCSIWCRFGRICAPVVCREDLVWLKEKSAANTTAEAHQKDLDDAKALRALAL
jgi:hypothetical protein